jgi:hypothetical protein
MRGVFIWCWLYSWKTEENEDLKALRKSLSPMHLRDALDFYHDL